MSAKLHVKPLCPDCRDSAAPGYLEDEDGRIIQKCPCRDLTPTAEQRRDRAIRQTEAAHPTEKLAARKVVEDAAYMYPEFTANTIRHLFQFAGVTHTALIGGAFVWASKQGLIRDTGRTDKSTDDGTHAKKLAVWASLKYGQPAPVAADFSGGVSGRHAS